MEAAICSHLDQIKVGIPDEVPGCEECLKTGDGWVHLRVCLACGNVACCDSSFGRHATAHFEQSGHPVMRSAEPGELWRWCYVDGRLG